jgi:hypothetical protein
VWRCCGGDRRVFGRRYGGLEVLCEGKKVYNW